MGSRVPSSMRAHPFSIRVRKSRGNWQLLGNITFTVCKLGPAPTPPNDPVPDEQKPKIFVRFRADFKRFNAEYVRFQGRYRLAGGTQRYEDLTSPRGGGDMAGYLFCFASEGCAAKGGRYLDGQFTMQSFYRDPTPQLSG